MSRRLVMDERAAAAFEWCEQLDALALLSPDAIARAVADEGVPLRAFEPWKPSHPRRHFERIMALHGEGLRLRELARELAAFRCSVESAAVMAIARERIWRAAAAYVGDREALDGPISLRLDG